MSLLIATLLIILGVVLALLCYLVVAHLERERIRHEREEVLPSRREEVEDAIRRQETVEEREFQLELLRVQIEHQDILSVLSLFIAVLFTAMISLATTYMGFYFISKDVNFAYLVIAVVVCFPIAMGLVVLYYRGPGAREVRENLQKELDRIRKEFIARRESEKT